MRRKNSLVWGDIVWVNANTMGMISTINPKQVVHLRHGEIGVFFQEIGERSIVMFEHSTLSIRTDSIRLTSEI